MATDDLVLEDMLDVTDDEVSRAILELQQWLEFAAAIMPKGPPGGQYGNGDVGVFPADSSMAKLINFWHEGLVPPTSKCTIVDGVKVPERAWSLARATMEDLSHGYASLAFTAYCYTGLVKDAEIATYLASSRLRAIRHLRRQVDLGIVNPGAVTMLLAHELITRDYDAATTHASFLFKLLEQAQLLAASSGGIKIGMNRHCLFFVETMRTTALMVPTHRLVDEWQISTRDLDRWATTSPDTALVERATSTALLDITALSDATLIALFEQIRRLDAYMHASLDANYVTYSAAYQLSCSLIVLSGRLLNYSLDLTNDPLRRAAALAALYYLRLRERSEFVNFSSSASRGEAFMLKCFSQGPLIAANLSDLLVQSDREGSVHTVPSAKGSPMLSKDESDWESIGPELRLRIWILYVGAFIEQTADYTQSPNLRRTHHHEGLQFQLVLTSLLARAYADLLAGFLVLPVQPGAATVPLLEDLIEPELQGMSEIPASIRRSTSETHANQQGEQDNFQYVYGPKWLNMVLRTWGIGNRDGGKGVGGFKLPCVANTAATTAHK
ncbi:uncharacterized protein AB675_1649 [Cyphellophora attinorum]|uniref:Transcription factor domain-containing protein n=1 Tax=Cyphellophora attinorum TaxID=1664694 RepID=A0A0N1HMP4_9EURO|nr:uncharacterized protein AB675_1649 [Phialophora attinorum]KPI36087.1 hypothetical protein AB675_1649 [Phialophora attinorum]